MARMFAGSVVGRLIAYVLFDQRVRKLSRAAARMMTAGRRAGPILIDESRDRFNGWNDSL